MGTILDLVDGVISLGEKALDLLGVPRLPPRAKVIPIERARRRLRFVPPPEPPRCA